LSRPHLCYCPVFDCPKNRHTVHADAAQTKNHLWDHSFQTLLKTAKILNLIEDYARPKEIELVEILAEHCIIRSDSHVC